MALRGQVVNLIRLHFLDDADQVGGIGQVPVVQPEAHLFLVRVGVQMVDPRRVEGGGAALDAVDLVALAQKVFRQVRSVLTGNACDQCFFHSLPILVIGQLTI